MIRASAIILLALLGTVSVRAQLTLHLTFDSSGALLQDGSANQFAQDYVQGTIGHTASGVAGGAAEFNGSSYVRWNSSVAATLAGSFTVSLWINTTQGFGLFEGEPAYAGAGIVYADVPGHSTDAIPLALSGTRAAFMTDDGNTDTTIHSTSAINTGTWMHLASTYDVTTGVMRLYVNGTLQASATVATVSHNARGLLFLGANDFDSRYFTGAVDDFQLYSVALSAADVSFLAQNPGLVAVPEPPVHALIGLGLGGVAWLHRRRQARPAGQA